jgi:glycosyltransferase involved in cell wall biosynthesis
MRSLAAAGFDEVSISGEICGDSACLIIRAGLVLQDPSVCRPPPDPDNEQLVAVGLPVCWDEKSEWSRFQSLHGGVYPADGLPAPLCEWHSSGNNARARLLGMPFSEPPLMVHWARLDHAPDDPRLFVMEVVTSLQHGGAERITCDLAVNLPRHGVRSRLVSLGKPHRKPLPAPGDTLYLSHLRRSERVSILTNTAIASGVDVIHVHLTNADEIRAISACGIPVMATVHNARAGWPQGWETLKAGDVSLFLACSQAAEAELREVLPHVPVRTVWNGISPNDFPESRRPQTGNEFTLACVANPRPQKRLERLAQILAATREELRARGVRNPVVKLIIAGEVSEVLADAVCCREAVDLEARKHGVSDSITWTHGKLPVREVLQNAQALVSCSAYEGLSLAHLEAISSGLPVIACDTGGTRELAWKNPAVSLLPAKAGAEEFAKSIATALLAPPPSGHPVIWRDFSTDRMTRRVAMLARQTACRPSQPCETLWFVTNNLSTGGAQSSLRRLVKELHAGGKRVRVALLQEYPEHPTPGRDDLLAAGIDVFVPPPAGLIDPQNAVDRIVAEMTADPPAAVVFWNAIMTHKLLLADALPFTKVYDVSPGGMWFSSLDRYFENPLPGIPCRSPGDYGKLLAGIVVKYAAEAPRATALGAKVTVIPNGVVLPERRTPRPLDFPFVFGTAARVSPQKRLDELIEAFRLAMLPNAVLRIAGGVETGAEECAEDLRKRSEGLQVEWLGEMHGLSEFHQGCDVFVMISDPAGCPNASLEALAAGLPVIATDVGGASEQVIDSVNGRLVPSRDVPALAKAMVEMSRDRQLLETMSSAAREHIRRHFTLDQMTASYLALFTGENEIPVSRRNRTLGMRFETNRDPELTDPKLAGVHD